SLGFVLVALGIFCCRRLLPHHGLGEEIVCSCRMHQLLCEAALRRRGLEVVFVLRKILCHGDEFAATLVPRVRHGLQLWVSRFDGCIFLHRVLGMGGKCECQQDDSEKRYSFHFFLHDGVSRIQASAAYFACASPATTAASLSSISFQPSN